MYTFLLRIYLGVEFQGHKGGICQIWNSWKSCPRRLLGGSVDSTMKVWIEHPTPTLSPQSQNQGAKLGWQLE